ncbi:OmpA family protein [Lysobacter sp. K5869]|uniref:OmpA family protein n=1 Tax=Lysobacter sp. K5869 TaxID=2820808 RepID=UPI001C063B64|nr:OmpA family protein [Lysobacter sp. K5869]QWP79140.1 OmpA family protein [Lysobacter sp. K5869]
MSGSTDERFTRTEAMLLDTIRMMKAFPDWRFEIRASTDNEECVGSACAELSLRRAIVVRDWLLEHGAPAASLKPLKALGSMEPLADNSTEDGRRINRRVEFAVELPSG